MKKITIEFKPRSEKNKFGGGFLTQWASGKDDVYEIESFSGAGLGNPCLSICVTQSGHKVWFDADVRDIMTALIEKIKKDASKRN